MRAAGNSDNQRHQAHRGDGQVRDPPSSGGSVTTDRRPTTVQWAELPGQCWACFAPMAILTTMDVQEEHGPDTH